MRFKGRSLRLHPLFMNGIVMNIAEKKMTAGIIRIHPSLINLDPRIGRPKMPRMILRHYAR